MPGAIIPDDWDGLTYKCKRVIWPSSELWEAILFGQITEPQSEHFWDETTGDVDDTVSAMAQAETLTSPLFFTGECDMIPGHPVSAFSAYHTSHQIVFAGVWNKVDWNTLAYSHNDPGFDLADDVHYPIPEDKDGIWHYDVEVTFSPSGQYWACRAIEEDSDLQLARVDQALTRCNLSFDYDWGEGGTGIAIEMFSPLTFVIGEGRHLTWFSGHYLGETE